MLFFCVLFIYRLILSFIIKPKLFMKKYLLLVIGISLFNFISCTESKLLKPKVKKVVSVRNTRFKNLMTIQLTEN